MAASEHVSVSIPAALYRRIEGALTRFGAPSVDAFVIHAIRQALAPYEGAPEPGQAEEAQIVDRLRRLGYIE